MPQLPAVWPRININICILIFKCVKCAGKHKSTECHIQPERKMENFVRKCSNCQGLHTANHIDCPAYLQYLETLMNKRNRTQQPRRINATAALRRENISYGNIASGQKQHQPTKTQPRQMNQAQFPQLKIKTHHLQQQTSQKIPNDEFRCRNPKIKVSKISYDEKFLLK